MLSKNSRKSTAFFASFATAGVLLLSACGGGDTKPSASAPAAGGSMDLALKSGTAQQNNAPKKTGDWANPPGKAASQPVQRKWVQLSASRAGDLDPVVVNGSGFTLYRFDKDTASPSKSTCNGACATTWPPVLVDPGSKIFVDGVNASDVGVVRRDDGTRQVTVDGWPVYRFSKDLKPGDTNGQGVGGTWFGVQPDGQKSGAPVEAEPTEAPDQAQAAPASSAILFDDANFSDNGPAQGVAGQGCQNVARPKVTSSISVSGSMKLWTAPNCKGTSKVVNGDVADLSTIGFDNKISSVTFG
ncbi:hypothetical protein GCM10009837_46410 [Streptomyces durmitorensis]|uniref:Lipoprotein n=1 Tax=Streptomyces durmitorensis TaxID=319947 RepID=A0ABY4Q4T2_9ACTN|nr:hypothetical protein [Streptomyces durmitorensis]UQT60379.1 hypothetical protein M4V62_37900 [Streptomyces durmitorensis]